MCLEWGMLDNKHSRNGGIIHVALFRDQGNGKKCFPSSPLPIFPAGRFRESNIMVSSLLDEACAWLSPQWSRVQLLPVPTLSSNHKHGGCLLLFRWTSLIPVEKACALPPAGRFVAQGTCGCLPCVLPISAAPGCTWPFGGRTQKPIYVPQNESICTKGLNENWRFCTGVQQYTLKNSIQPVFLSKSPLLCAPSSEALCPPTPTHPTPLSLSCKGLCLLLCASSPWESHGPASIVKRNAGFPLPPSVLPGTPASS